MGRKTSIGDIEKEAASIEEERDEAESVLSSMVNSLNELPTPVLQQLLDNLNAIEAYNKKHGLSAASSHGAYVVAGLEELLEHNEPFLCICLLDEYIKTRMIDSTKPLRAILLFRKEEDVESYISDRSWVNSFANAQASEAARKEGYAEVFFTDDFALRGELYLISLESLDKGLPAKLREELLRGFRIPMSKPPFDEAYFLGLLK